MSWNLSKRISGDVVTAAPVELPGGVSYHDARSAAFYALGVAVKKRQPVTLVVPGQYLPSTYTAITEAWFQKANVIVLALFEKVSDVKTAWIDRCVLHSTSFGAEEQAAFQKELEAARGLHGPVLFNLVGACAEEPPVDYSVVLPTLRTIAADAGVWAYHPKCTDDVHLRPISARDKYGVISKYIGMSAVADAGILLCPARCALLDMNIFRTRYANGNMKIILLDEDGKLNDLHVVQWAESNGWECLQTGTADVDACKWLVSRKRQAVMIVR